jgi:uncharacterized membrane protein
VDNAYGMRTNLTVTNTIRNQGSADIVLWGIAAVYVVGTLVTSILPNPTTFSLLVLLLFPFALIHGTVRYGLKGIVVFVVIVFIVSSILENMSILTGFPFGHYYYTDTLGPKLFLVPLFISPSYITFGYFAWVLSTIVVGEVRLRSTFFTAVTVPLVASFMMVAWDLSLDTKASTINHAWIWTQGGGYFGVPFTNFLGWSFTVYIFFQLFALFLRRFGPESLGRPFPITHYLQTILVYMWTGVGNVLGYLFGPANMQITDAIGHVWQTRDIYETSAIFAIYTMIFISVLALVILYRDRLYGKNGSTTRIAKHTT